MEELLGPICRQGGGGGEGGHPANLLAVPLSHMELHNNRMLKTQKQEAVSLCTGSCTGTRTGMCTSESVRRAHACTPHCTCLPTDTFTSSSKKSMDT